jgi:transposase
VAPSKKGALREGRTPVFMDESAFSLLPAVVSTWAPVGETPVLKAPLSREHLSVLGAVTEDGRVSLSPQERPVTGRDVIRFLGRLKRVIGGEVLVLLDGATIHRCAEFKAFEFKAFGFKAFLSSPAGAGIQMAPLPAYAPKLNPSEGLWRYSKQELLGNVCSHEAGEPKRMS